MPPARRCTPTGWRKWPRQTTREAAPRHRQALSIADVQDPVAALRAWCLAWIRLAGDPVVRQIVLIDAPAVLGWQRWRELDENNLGTIKMALGYAADAGRIDRQHVAAFAHLILAGGNEVAMMVALADDPAGALADGESAMATFLDRLLGPDRALTARVPVNVPRRAGRAGATPES